MQISDPIIKTTCPYVQGRAMQYGANALNCRQVTIDYELYYTDQINNFKKFKKVVSYSRVKYFKI